LTFPSFQLQGWLRGLMAPSEYTIDSWHAFRDDS
jgi:hypothetical protein